MSPFAHHAKKSMISILDINYVVGLGMVSWNAYWKIYSTCIIGSSGQRHIKFKRGCLWCKVKHLECFQNIECGGSTWISGCWRKELGLEKLDIFRNQFLTPAVIQMNLLYTVWVNNGEVIVMRSRWQRACVCLWVSKLYAKSHCLKRHLFKWSPIPYSEGQNRSNVFWIWTVT